MKFVFSSCLLLLGLINTIVAQEAENLRTPKALIENIDQQFKVLKGDPEQFKAIIDQFLKEQLGKPDGYYDAVFIHVTRQYVVTDFVDWIGPEEKKWFIDRANGLEANLPGQLSPNLSIPDENRQVQTLHDAASQHDFTLLLFWDTDCEHCQNLSQQLSTQEQSWKTEHDIGFFTVSGEYEKELWLENIKQLSGNNWIHTYDDPEQAHPQSLEKYYLESSPTLFVIERSGIIRAKFVDLKAVFQLDAVFNAESYEESILNLARIRAFTQGK